MATDLNNKLFIYKKNPLMNVFYMIFNLNT